MAINRTGVALTFYAMFVDSTNLDGETGLTVTVDVYEGVMAAPIVSAGSATELAGGLYYYTLASGSVDAEGGYVCMFKTASADVVQKHIPALWSVWAAGAPVDAIGLSGDTTAANNAESFFDGTGYAGGTIKLGVDLVAILGTALTETAGYLAAGFKKLFNVATPVLTAESVNQTGDSYAVVTHATYGLDKLARTGADSDTLETLSDQLDLQATAVALATAQADLDNPAQYKADVSALALEATAQSILTDTGTTLPADIAALPTANENADQVWDELIAGHVGAGSTGEALTAAGAAGDPWITALPGAYVEGQAGYIVGTTITGALTSIASAVAAAAAAVWAYATRTLTQTAQQIGDAIDGSTITVHRGDELSASLTDLGAIPADRTAFWFTVKTDPEDQDDDEAIIQIEETDGLLYLNATAATVAQAALASLTVDDEATGDVTIWISDSITAALARTSGINYDFQYLDADGEAHTLAAGMLIVTVDVTRATRATS